MRIVIIEDEEDLGFLMKSILNRTLQDEPANQIQIATSIRDGFVCIEEINPQLIFLDNNLPDGKGINSVRDIKKKATDSVLIMMSAITTIRKEALESGADFFLDKPINLSEVSHIVKKLLDKDAENKGI